MNGSVRLHEVSLRDGLQNEPEVVETADKLSVLAGLIRAGFQDIEVTSFVRPRWIPQLADAAEVVRNLPPAAGVRFWALVPNQVGLDRAHEAGIEHIATFLSASETHNRKNVNRTVRESLAGLREVISSAKAEKMQVRAYISTVFGCEFEGEIPVERSIELGHELLAAGADILALGDTTGMGNASHQGKLRQAAGVRWVHASTPNPTNVLSSMISMGTTGSSSTRGLDAVYAALEVQAAGYNEGFRREGAPLGVVVMSDDDDHSAISPADFEAWFTGLDGDPTLHAIVPTADGACAPDPVGLVYLDVVGATGGITSPSCAAGWADVIEGAVERFDPQGRSRFALEQTPIPETLRAEVDTSGVLVVYEAAELGWEEDTNTVVLPTPAVADAQVTIRYAQTPRPN